MNLGATVIMACRRVESASRVAKSFKDLKGSYEILELDLSSFANVRRFVEEFKNRYSRLNALVNNAGVMNTPKMKTVDGFEYQFGVNYLGHFLLTELLKDILVESAPSRVSLSHITCYASD